MAINGGDACAGFYHDNVGIRVWGKEHGLDHRDRHGHVGNVLHGVVEKIGSDTLYGRFGLAGVWVILQGDADAEADGCVVKESP